MKRLSFEKHHLGINYNNQTRPSMNFHSHSHYEIFYFHAGRCNYLIGDRIYTLTPGDLIIMNGMTLHRPKLFDEEAYCRTTVHFNGDYFQEVFKAMGMQKLLQPFTTLQSFRIQMSETEQAEVDSLLQKMKHYQSEEEVSYWRFQLSFFELLVVIYQLCQRPLNEMNETASDKEKHVQRLISFLEEHYRNSQLNMEVLEEALHVSRYYLSKVFKEVTGVTVFNYLYQRRINQAKIDFLIHPDRSVTEVSYSVGFKHPAHFSKIFKQLVGISPEKFRREQMV